VSAADEIAALEERRAKKQAERAEAEAVQHLADLTEREKLEDEFDAVATVKVARFIPGQPTIAIVKTPGTAEYKRYLDQVGRAVDKKSTAGQRAAQELLAHSCWIYPREVEARKAMLDAFPGILTPIVIAATQLAEGKVEEEVKG
jgi:hypothetical protein